MNKFEIRYIILNFFIGFAFYFYLVQGLLQVNAVKMTVGIVLVLYYHFRLKKAIFRYLNEQEQEWKKGDIFKSEESQVVGEKAKGQYGK